MIRPRQDFWGLIYATTPNLAKNPPTTLLFTKPIKFSILIAYRPLV